MFFDNVQSQANTQNTNLSNNISIGSSGTDFGRFAPVNETKPEFKSSNDLGLSAALGDGASSGSVGMSRGETVQKSGSTYDGYSSQDEPVKSKTNIFILAGIGLAVLLSVFAIFKKGK